MLRVLFKNKGLLNTHDENLTKFFSQQIISVMTWESAATFALYLKRKS